jgi:hypothetical protein
MILGFPARGAVQDSSRSCKLLTMASMRSSWVLVMVVTSDLPFVS